MGIATERLHVVIEIGSLVMILILILKVGRYTMDELNVLDYKQVFTYLLT